MSTKTEELRQARSVRLDKADWLALAELAKAHNRSVNNYLESLVKTAIAKSGAVTEVFKAPPIKDDTLMSKEAFFAKIDKALQSVEAGNYHTMLPGESVEAFMDRMEAEGYV